MAIKLGAVQQPWGSRVVTPVVPPDVLLAPQENKMASVRQVDTALWLHNKLSSDDSWSGSSLRSLLTQDVLRNIPECFHRLETQVKVKLLMAFLHLPRRVIEETNAELGEIFEIGSHDEDEWVRVLSEILKYYPSTGMLNVNLDQVSPVFAEVTEEIEKTGQS